MLGAICFKKLNIGTKGVRASGSYTKGRKREYAVSARLENICIFFWGKWNSVKVW